MYTYCAYICIHIYKYIYFNKIDTDNDRKFTFHLENTLSNKPIGFLALSKNKQYYITN